MEENLTRKSEALDLVSLPLDRAATLQLFAASAVRLGVPHARANEAAHHCFDLFVNGSAKYHAQSTRDLTHCGRAAQRRVDPEVAVLQFLGRLSSASRELAILNNVRPHIAQYQVSLTCVPTSETGTDLGRDEICPSPG